MTNGTYKMSNLDKHYCLVFDKIVVFPELKYRSDFSDLDKIVG